MSTSRMLSNMDSTDVVSDMLITKTFVSTAILCTFYAYAFIFYRFKKYLDIPKNEDDKNITAEPNPMDKTATSVPQNTTYFIACPRNTFYSLPSITFREQLVNKIISPKSPWADSDEDPDDYCCPITKELMRDPVTASDTFSYERCAIEQWLDTNPNPCSPVLGNKTKLTRTLVPNQTLKNIITQHKEDKKRNLAQKVVRAGDYFSV